MEQVDKDSWKILGKGFIGLFALIGFGFCFFKIFAWVLALLPNELEPNIVKYGNWIAVISLVIYFIFWIKNRIKMNLLEGDHGMLGNKRKYTNSTEAE